MQGRPCDALRGPSSSENTVIFTDVHVYIVSIFVLLVIASANVKSASLYDSELCLLYLQIRGYHYNSHPFDGLF